MLLVIWASLVLLAFGRLLLIELYGVAAVECLLRVNGMRIKFFVRSFFKGIVFLFLAASWGGVLAAPAPPPLLCVDGGDCVSTAVSEPSPEPPAGGGGYTLASIGNVPFAYSTPAPPNITSEATVTPATIEENKVNGRRLILSPGDYGPQNFNTQDQEIVFQPGANFGFLRVGMSARRLVFRGSPARSGSIGYMKVGDKNNGTAQDILFDGINQVHNPSAPQWEMRNVFYAERVAVINSNMQVREYAALSYSRPGIRLQDVIFANNNMVDLGTSLAGTGNGEAVVRFVGSARVVFVDNRVVSYLPDGYHTLRIHAAASLDAEDFYVARNQLEGAGQYFIRSGDGSPTQELRNIYFEDNVQYTSLLSAMNAGNDASSRPTSFTMRNNTLYGSTGGWPSVPAGYSWQFSGNSYQSYQNPPVWQFQ